MGTTKKDRMESNGRSKRAGRRQKNRPGKSGSSNNGASGTDAAWGFAKGVLMRAAVSNIAKGETSPALMSLKLVVASRVVDVRD